MVRRNYLRRRSRKSWHKCWWQMPANDPRPDKDVDNIVISFPRSGLNWVRYCSEFFSRKRTLGQRRPVPESHLTSDEILFHRTHDAERWSEAPSNYCCTFYTPDGEPMFEGVVLLLRNYKESYVRNDCDDHFEEIATYFDNIRAYHEFPRKKLLVHYEDLITDFSYMCKILDFLNVDYDLSNFNVNFHSVMSIMRYHRQANLYGHNDESLTIKNPNNLLFHSSKLSPEERSAMDDQFKKSYPVFFDKYLNRYLEENLDYGSK